MTRVGFLEGFGLDVKKVCESGRRGGLGVCKRSRLVLRVRNRNLDDVRLDEKEEDDDVQEGSGLEDSDVIIVSRRELLAAIFAAFGFTSTILAAQRYSSIRRWSFTAFRGVLRERYPPTSGNSVALARFMMEGIKNGPIANLKNLTWINVQPPRLKDRLLLVHIWRMSDVRTMDIMARLEKVIFGMKKELSGAVATLSVHCAKFDSERIPPFIQEAAEEMRWRHSVASDTDLSLWKSIGVEAWPTILILSPNDHRVLVALTGDRIGRLEECLYASLSLYKKAQLQTSSFPLPKVMKPSMTWDAPLLRYPSRIAIDTKGGKELPHAMLSRRLINVYPVSWISPLLVTSPRS
uniref:Thioredoxin-like fold domain-containing protein n=1 Tax=Rhodosorus marinus TaxID=101924 RepID=A0A7S3A0M0_9RHOD